MHILCPHCRNPIEIVKLIPREEIACPSCGSNFRLETESTTGWQPGSDKLGKFDLIEVVGQGAFGTVYKAHDTELDRTVAVKVASAPATSPDNRSWTAFYERHAALPSCATRPSSPSTRSARRTACPIW